MKRTTEDQRAADGEVLDMGETGAVQSLVDAATDAIRDRILDLSLAPGRSINNKTLVSELGLSRTPVREALNRLAAEGLIHFETNLGVYVRPLDVAEVEQLTEAYRVCEQLSAHFCDFSHPNLYADVSHMQDMQRAALARHEYLEASYWNYRQRLRVAETCGNQHLIEFYRRTVNQMRRLSVLIYRIEARDPHFYERQIDLLSGMHTALRGALKAQSREELKRVLMDHFDIFQTRITNSMKAHRSESLQFE